MNVGVRYRCRVALVLSWHESPDIHGLHGTWRRFIPMLIEYDCLCDEELE